MTTHTAFFPVVGLTSAAVVLVLLAAGCSTAADTTRAGGDPAPVTLRLGTADGPGRPGADQIEEFARQVVSRSDGQVQIEPVWEIGEDMREWDQVVARMVVAGELDLGMVPARAWDTEGVTSFQAIHAPFLVTSEALVSRIVTDDLATDMLAGLGDVGVTGLALVPEGLRRLFAFGDEPVTPGSLDGAVVRAPRSETTYALFTALGATPDDPNGLEVDDGIADGTIAAAESSFLLAGGLPSPQTTTDGLVLFPKVNSLVANSDVFESLSGDQQDAVRAAAEATVEWWMAAEQSADAEQARTYCANGGRVVTPDETGVEVLTEAVAEVYASLEADPATARMIEQIRDLAAGLPTAEPLASCEPPDRPVAAATGIGDFPPGFYRADVTTESLTEKGVDRVTAADHTQVWTLGFGADGQLVPMPGEDCEGTWSVVDGRIEILFGEGVDCGDAENQVLFSAGWVVGDDDAITFTDVQSGHGSDLLIQALFGDRPFARVGDAPVQSETTSATR